eukprot:CAMPEP_0178474156 /NCGR_PEP_ID=MMETSP0696-20121128/2457_1 /TAXON_ID=265572 /ORGANISM="Extubocellulus spinifer, Strain CCMP396" /LENGTH=41 /DNA_ID= /DNA_START= /DNA_END= /DNA_ORIENTATION=
MAKWQTNGKVTSTFLQPVVADRSGNDDTCMGHLAEPFRLAW